MRFRISIAIALIACALPVLRVADAADPIEINAVLSMTGSAAFIGKADAVTLQAFQNSLNQSGGIAGRPIKFTVADDGSSPQIAVQLTNDLIAKKVSVIIGSSLSSTCSAMMPLAKAGPVIMCLSNAIVTVPDTFTFAAVVSTRDHLASGIRYARMKNLHRIALIVSSDTSGQNGERAIDDVLTDPLNKTMTIVDREHFNLTDISVAAQVARMKAAHPDVIAVWTTGTPAATVLRALSDAGMQETPVLISPGNATYVQMEQYASFLPQQLLFTLPIAMVPDRVTDPAVRASIQECLKALAPLSTRLDLPVSSAWDAAVLVTSGIKKLGANVSAEALRAYIANSTGISGTAGRYDFRAMPQRGIGEKSEYVARWDAGKAVWVGVSKAGGEPL
jgi:ABC-type branched-subunit amino acid transport system substrate-binding protein